MPAEKAPRKRKAVAAPASKRVVRAKPVAAALPKRNEPPPVPSGEQRLALIAEAAYFRAERRGFAGGSELEDWLQAEVEVDGWLANQASISKPKRRSGTATRR
jgi:hypothetical protein